MIALEGKLFCLLLIGSVCVFQKHASYQCYRQYRFVYLFSVLGILCSALESFAVNRDAQNVSFVLCLCCYEMSALLWCKEAFKKAQNIKPMMRNMISALTLVAFGALAFASLQFGLNAAIYLLSFAMIFSFAIDQYNKIRMDNLTKLYNRYGMDAELKEQLRQYEHESENSFYLIVCDLDNFKHINDTWGHLEGDRALVLIAGVLSKVAKRFRSNVFRIGGDEFVIITDTSEKELAFDITKALKNELDNIEFRDDFDIKMSIGVALYDGVTSVDDLLNRADKKLYEAKKRKHKLIH